MTVDVKVEQSTPKPRQSPLCPPSLPLHAGTQPKVSLKLQTDKYRGSMLIFRNLAIFRLR